MKKDLKLEINDYLPLREVVFLTLRQAILKGELEPGERLMEISLANQLGVSRTPIREAIRKLELEGLVVMVPRKGAEVASITEKDMKDVLELRCALDAFSVKLACERMSQEELEKLDLANKDFEEAIVSHDLIKIAEADVKFHEVIYNATTNQRLIQMISNLREQMYRYRLEYLKDARNHSILINEHNDIIKSIKDGDVEAAQKMVTTHIQNQEKCIYKLISK